MGKQNNTENKIAAGVVFIIIIMGIILLIFAFATLIAPIIVLVLFLINWIRYLVQDRKRKATNFWLSAEEQEQYEKVTYILVHAEDEKRKIQDSVITQGIYRNQDGQISQRSYAGKGLRDRENTNNSIINKYTPIYEELQLRPYTRWKKARSHYSKAFGFGFIIFTIMVMFGITQLRNNNTKEEFPLSTLVSETIDSTKVVVQSNEIEQTEKAEQSEQAEKAKEDSSKDTDLVTAAFSLYGISIGLMAGFLAALVVIWLIGWLIGRIRFGLKNPEPPLVNIDNVDTYIEKYMEKKARKKAKRQQQKERLRQKREQKRITKKLAKEEKTRIAEQKSEEENQKVETESTSHVYIAELEKTSAVPMENNTRKQSKEEKLFISWANILRNKGYNITGNWEDWENSGLWKNLAVVSSVNGIDIRIVVEYYVKSKKIYFGIAKLNDEEKISQELLNSETFQNIITENGLTVKSNEWWYCLKYSTLDKVFQEYWHLIEVIN